MDYRINDGLLRACYVSTRSCAFCSSSQVANSCSGANWDSRSSHAQYWLRSPKLGCFWRMTMLGTNSILFLGLWQPFCCVFGHPLPEASKICPSWRLLFAYITLSLSKKCWEYLHLLSLALVDVLLSDLMGHSMDLSSNQTVFLSQSCSHLEVFPFISQPSRRVLSFLPGFSKSIPNLHSIGIWWEFNYLHFIITIYIL